MLLTDSRRDAPMAAMKDMPTSMQPGAQTGLHGAVRVGGMILAVPIDTIREVVPRPAQLLPFPCVHGAVVGAIELRGAIIPVLDAVQLLGLTPGVGACPVILILRSAGRVIGLAIEAIGGVFVLSPDNVTHLAFSNHGSLPPLTPAAFVHGDMQGLVLDIAAMGALQSLPFSLEQRQEGALQDISRHGVPTLFFTIGTIKLGLAAHLIEASVHEQPIVDGPAENDFWLGWIFHNGRRIPLVDTLRLLMLGQCEPATRTAAVVVRLPSGRLVGLRIDAVNDMQRVAAREIRSLQGFMSHRHQLFAGLYGLEQPSVLLDPVTLQADNRLNAIGAMCDLAPPKNPIAQNHHARVTAFLVVRLADKKIAISLDQIDEIVTTSRSDIKLTDDEQGVVGFTIHRDRGVPLLNLHLLLGLAHNNRTPPFTVLATAHGSQAGFMVDEICSVQQSGVQILQEAGSTQKIIRILAKAGEAHRSCPVIDLHPLIEARCQPPQARERADENIDPDRQIGMAGPATSD